MKTLKRKLAFLGVTTILLSTSLFGQSGKLISKGDKQFRKGLYQNAIDFYTQAKLTDKNTAEVSYKIGEAYRLSNRVYLAQEYYEKSLAAGGNYQNAKFYLGYAYKMNEKYDEAIAQFSLYLEEGSETAFWDLAKLELNNLASIKKILEDEKKKNEYIHLYAVDSINTEGGEYSPFIIRDSTGAATKLYYTSTSEKDIFGATGQGFSRLFLMHLTDTVNNIGYKEKVDIPFLVEKANYNIGTVAVSKDGKTIIFARGNSGKRKDKIKDVSLFITEFNDTVWSEPVLMPFSDPKVWDSSPAFSNDGETLYFSSTRAGGYGGTDLYRVKRRRNGTWDTPQNMGSKINTPQNEMFPYVSEDGRLYFASDGHPGFGGLDIFEATRKNRKTAIENLGLKYNSSYDDFSLVWRDTLSGYFSSNRPGGKGDDDLFFFYDKTPPKFDFFVEVGLRYNDDGGDKDGNFFAGEPILGANVKVLKRIPPKTLTAGQLEMAKINLVKKYETNVQDSLVNVLAADVKDSLVSQYAEDILEPLTAKLEKEAGEELATEYILNVKDSLVEVYEEKVNDSLAVALAPVINEVKDSLIASYEEAVKDSLENPVSEEFEEVGEYTTGKYGKLKFQMDPDTEYTFVMAKKGTLTKRVTFKAPPKKDIPIDELIQVGIKDTTFRQEYELDRPEVGDIITMGRGKNGYEFDQIYYDYDSYYFQEKDNPQLEKLVTFLKDNQNIRVELRSHCDDRGTDVYNLRLSQKRSNFVIEYLTAKGIPSEQIEGRGYGKFILKIQNAQTEEEHQENRRTEIKIVEILNQLEDQTPEEVAPVEESSEE